MPANLFLSTSEGFDLLIAVEFELAVRCQTDSPMRRLLRIQEMLKAELGVKK